MTVKDDMALQDPKTGLSAVSEGGTGLCPESVGSVFARCLFVFSIWEHNKPATATATNAPLDFTVVQLIIVFAPSINVTPETVSL